MSVVGTGMLDFMSIEDCQRLDAPLRHDLEILDYETRRLVTRMAAESRARGESDARYFSAAATILLAVAAQTMARAAEERCATFDVSAFAAGAQNAGQWAQLRALRVLVAGEA